VKSGGPQEELLRTKLVEMMEFHLSYLKVQDDAVKVLSNMLSTFVVAFLPRNKCLLISWLQSLCVVILKLKKIKFVTPSTFSPSICHEVMGPNPLS